MDLIGFRDYCLSKPGTSEDTPFDENTLVFRVMGKIFAITDIENFEFVNLKCNPDRAAELRHEHDEIRPGYHMNKKHWNSVYTTGSLPDKQILELADHSYDLIVSSLPKKLKEELNQLKEQTS